MTAPQLPSDLHDAIKADLQPVTPLSPVARRMLNALAVSAVVFAVAVLFLGLRSDITHIPAWLGWDVHSSNLPRPPS